MNEWLRMELVNAKSELAAAERREELSEDALDGITRGYWSGYVDALDNALDQLIGGQK